MPGTDVVIWYLCRCKCVSICADMDVRAFVQMWMCEHFVQIALTLHLLVSHNYNYLLLLLAHVHLLVSHNCNYLLLLLSHIHICFFAPIAPPRTRSCSDFLGIKYILLRWAAAELPKVTWACSNTYDVTSQLIIFKAIRFCRKAEFSNMSDWLQISREILIRFRSGKKECVDQNRCYIRGWFKNRRYYP